MSSDRITLALDIGTGSVRAGLVDASGRVLRIASRAHDQIVPRYGWSEQRPMDWWNGARAVIREVLEGDAGRVAAVCACGQMHATVLVDEVGGLTRDTAPLWNDKRTNALVERFAAIHDPETYLGHTANPPTPAWPAFKLQWLARHDAGALARAAHVLAPKDWINLKLTGRAATDWTEASLSFLIDASATDMLDWAPDWTRALGLDPGLLPPIRAPHAMLGAVTAEAARETGLRAGTPVVVGGADFAMALLGSGAVAPGLASEVMGTSSIITVVSRTPVLDEEVSNLALPTVDGLGWGAFALLESGGDAMRWAGRALGDDSYEAMVEAAEAVPPGADGLFFLPYLTGERLGRHRNSRAQLFGLTAGHGRDAIHRSVLEGVAMAVKRHLTIMERAAGTPVTRLVASGGGVKADLWLRIKAGVYGRPIVVPEEPECGLIGCAALAAAALGRADDPAEAARTLVRFAREVAPDPALAETYARRQPLFERLYEASKAYWDDMDALSAGGI